MTSHYLSLVTLLCCLVPFTPLGEARADGPSGGIGVLGDSYSDEYQFYAPDRCVARNFVEILAATRALDFGPFSEADRGVPRGRGYAFNWAQSGATSDDLLATGQHTGVASQVAAGQVEFVWIFVGGNDFLRALNAQDPEEELRKAPGRILRNLREAIGTVLGASPGVKVVVATLPDVVNLPEVNGRIREGRLARSRALTATMAINQFNADLRRYIAGQPRLALMDLDFASRVGSLLGRRGIPVAGHSLVRDRGGDDLDSFFLADGRHPGLLAQGLLARAFVNTLNTNFSAGIRPLTDAELIRFAATVERPARETGLLAETGRMPSDSSTSGAGGSGAAAR